MPPETATEPSVQQAVPFFWVVDMEASLRFYVDGLGFKRTRKWIVDDKIDPAKFRINSTLVKYKKGNYVVLFENEYAMRTAMEKHPTAKFLETAP